jgi:hypothetical protein
MGVTLAADEGPEKTIIEGASASNPDSNGFGSDAIRCASVCKGAVLRGFTLRNGRCSNGETTEKDNYVMVSFTLSNPIKGWVTEGCVAKGEDGKIILYLVNPSEEKEQLQYFYNNKWWYIELLPRTLATIVFED